MGTPRGATLVSWIHPVHLHPSSHLGRAGPIGDRRWQWTCGDSASRAAQPPHSLPHPRSPGQQPTFHMLFGRCYPQSLEVLVRFWVHHQQPGLIFSCFDAGYHLCVAQSLHILPIHLPPAAQDSTEGRPPPAPRAAWPGVASNIHQCCHQPWQQEECQLKFPETPLLPGRTWGPHTNRGHRHKHAHRGHGHRRTQAPAPPKPW